MSAPIYCYTAEVWLVFATVGVRNSKGYCNGDEEDRDCYDDGNVGGDGNGNGDGDSNGNGNGGGNGNSDGDGKGNGDWMATIGNSDGDGDANSVNDGGGLNVGDRDGNGNGDSNCNGDGDDNVDIGLVEKPFQHACLQHLQDCVVNGD